MSSIITIILYLTSAAFTNNVLYLIYIIPLTIIALVLLLIVFLIGVIYPRTIEKARYYNFRDQTNKFIESNILTNKYLEPYMRMEMNLKRVYTTLFGKDGEYHKTSVQKTSKIIPHLIVYGRYTRTTLNTEANVENISIEEFREKAKPLPPTPKSNVTITLAKFEGSPLPSNVRSDSSRSLKKKVSFKIEHEGEGEGEAVI